MAIKATAACNSCSNETFELQKRGESPYIWLRCAGCNKDVAYLRDNVRELEPEHCELNWR